MKKCLFVLALSLVYTLTAYSQKKLSFGINVGYGLGNIINEKLEEVEGEGGDFRIGGSSLLDAVLSYNIFEDDKVVLQIGSGLRTSISHYSLTAADGDPLNFGQKTIYIPIQFSIKSKGTSVVNEFVRFSFDPIVNGESYKNNKLIDAKVAGALFGVALGLDIDTTDDGSFKVGMEFTGDCFTNGPISESFIQLFVGYSFGIF